MATDSRQGSVNGGGPGTAAELSTGPSDLPTDEVFDVFSNYRRRAALHYLKQRGAGEPVDMSELSTTVTAWEHDVETTQLDYDDRKSVHTSLYQFHVPKMDDAGLVEFDQQTSSVALTEAGESLDVYMETVSEEEVPWAVYFCVLSSLAVLAGVAAWVGLVPFMTGGQVTAATGVTMFVSSLAFLYDNRGMRIGTHGDPPTNTGD